MAKDQNSKSRLGKTTQNSLLISEIKDGVVLMKDGSLRGVILGSAVNFDLMSPDEQSAVEFSYQGFLNSLHFPIQIVVRSQKIELDQYIGKLQSLRTEQSNELLGLLMDDYISNIKALIQEVNIMDKQFYVVVPYFPPLHVAKGGTNIVSGIMGVFKPTPVVTVTEEEFKRYKQELSQRMALVSSGMSQVGIRAIALGTPELIDLYYSWYNPDTAVNQKLIDTDQLIAPAVMKGEGSTARGPLPGAPI
jgi:hypothetical protein